MKVAISYYRNNQKTLKAVDGGATNRNLQKDSKRKRGGSQNNFYRSDLKIL